MRQCLGRFEVGEGSNRSFPHFLIGAALKRQGSPLKMKSPAGASSLRGAFDFQGRFGEGAQPSMSSDGLKKIASSRWADSAESEPCTRFSVNENA